MALAADTANLIVALRLDDSGFSGKLNKAAGQLRAMDAGLSQMGRGAGQVAGGIARIGERAALAAAGGLAAVVHTAASYEEAFIGVEKTVDATEAQFEELEDTLKRMAGATGTRFEELAAIGETGGALGVAVEDLEAFIDVVNRLSVSTNLSSDQAATALGQLGTILDLNGEELRDLADSLVALGNAGSSTEAQIVDMAARFAAAGNSAGLSTEDILALSSAVASMGIEVEAGGTSLSRLFNNTTTNIGLANSKAKEFAEALGLTFDEFKTAWDNDALGTFEDLLEHLNTLDQFEGAALLKGIGITGTRDIAAIQAMAQNTEFLGEQLTIAEEAQGELNKESDKFFESTSRSWAGLVENVRNAAATIGTELLPVVNELMDDFVGWLNEPGTQRGLTDFANDLADGVRGLVSELKGTDFSGILGGLKLAAEVAKGAFDAFRNLPEPIQQLAIAALVANKVSGGAIGQIAAGLGNLVLGGLKTITATHVTVIGGSVTGGGPGLPGGGGGGGVLGRIGGLAAAATGVGLAATAGVMTVDFVGNAAAQQRNMSNQLDALARNTPQNIDESIARVEGAIEVANDGLINSWVSETGGINARLETELAELQNLKAAQERGVAAARDAIPWLQRNQQEIHNFNASEGTRFAQQQNLLAGVKSNTGIHTGLLGGILNKPSSTTVNVATTVVVSGSQVNQTLSSLRQTIGGGGFI